RRISRARGITGQRGEPLLTVEKELAADEVGPVLGDGRGAGGDRFVRLPHQDRPAGVAAVERVEQVAHAGGPPDVVPLDLGQPQLPALVHVHQAADRDVLLLHGWGSRITWGLFSQKGTNIALPIIWSKWS